MLGLLPEKECRVTSTGSWVGPKAGLDDLEKWKITNLCRESNHDLLVVQPACSLISIPTELDSLCAGTPHSFVHLLIYRSW